MTSDDFDKTYPLHAELKARLTEAQVLGGFLDWLDECDLTICAQDRHGNYFPDYADKARRIGSYMEIDPEALDEEKRAMLAALSPDTGPREG